MKEPTFKNIYIPNLCHENWDKMSRMEKGRFCKSCNKKVYDFTNATLEEIEIIFKNSKGNACGTFYADQINQDLKYLHKERPSLLQKLKLTATASLVYTWLKLFSVTSANAQEMPDSISPAKTISDNSLNKTLEELNQIRIKGILKDTSKGRTMYFVKFKIYDDKGKNIYASETDSKGEFDFSIPKEYEGRKIKLVTKRTKKNKPWSAYTYIYKSAAITFTAKEFQEILLETNSVTKKKLFRKKRPVMTGRFRM